MARRQKLAGKGAFLDHYRRIFPDPDEFERFLDSLQEPRRPVLRFHPNYAGRLRQMWVERGLSWMPLSWYPYAVEWPPEASPGQTLPGYNERLFYPMNASSLAPVLALAPQPGDSILDACAAPGGKALFIYEHLNEASRLVANDLSGARRAVMDKIFREYGVQDIETSQERAETIFKRWPESFDRILLDAPCSSEKHVYNNPAHLARWSPARVRQLQQRQYGLLSGLILALKPGGRIVYSTCAVTPEENEAVIARLLEKKGDLVQIEPVEAGLPGEGGIDLGESRNFEPSVVRRILPHRHGLDPMFVAVLRKRE
jgi:16S rRNA C967 or C1407 C5-methylase (RsmB/RsmF family)